MRNTKFSSIALTTILGILLSFPVYAKLQDQGLNSIMEIIDKAIVEINKQAEAEGVTEEQKASAVAAASSTVVNLSRTLGTLSYSRLQCGEADVLSEFTQRVQQMPELSRDAMRDAFQEGFDKSKKNSTLLSDDECKRLTASRKRTEVVEESNVTEDDSVATEAVVEEPKVEKPPEDPKFRHLRLAELSGQLAYKRKFCSDQTVFNKDFNAFLKTVPEEILEEVKTAYWKGYKHGKRLNKNLTIEQCS